MTRPPPASHIRLFWCLPAAWWGALFLALLPVARAQDDADTFADAASDWHLRFIIAEQDYQELLLRWAQASDAASAMRTQGSLERVDLEARLSVLRVQLDDMSARERALKRRMAAMEQGMALHNTMVDERRAYIDDARRALEVYLHTFTAEVEQARRPGPTLRAVELWWVAHTQMDWDTYFQTGEDLRVAPAEELEIKAAELSPQFSEAAKALLRLAADEEEHRRELHKLVLRHEYPDIALLREQIAEVEANIRDVQRRMAEAEAELAALGRQAPAAEQPELIQDMRSLFGEYRSLQDLLARPDSPDISIGSQRWCALHTHGGVLGVLLRDSGAPKMLRDAASAYGGSCAAPYNSALDDAFLASIWTEARFQVIQEEPVQVLFEEAEGTWHLDGVSLGGAGRQEVRVMPGLHRLEYYDGRAAQPVDTLVEQINAGDRLGFRVDRNQIVLDRLNGSEVWVVPVRSDPRVAEGEPDLTPDPGWRVAVYGTSLRFDAANHVGGSVEVRLVAGRWMPVALETGLAFDGLGSGTPYSYRGASTPALLRMRGVVLVRPLRELGPLTPAGVVSVGFIPPFQSVTLDFGGGLDWDVRPSWAVTARLGMNASFWQDDVTWMEPVVQLGVVRAFGASSPLWAARLRIRRARG